MLHQRFAASTLAVALGTPLLGLSAGPWRRRPRSQLRRCLRGWPRRRTTARRVQPTGLETLDRRRPRPVRHPRGCPDRRVGDQAATEQHVHGHRDAGTPTTTARPGPSPPTPTSTTSSPSQKLGARAPRPRSGPPPAGRPTPTTSATPTPSRRSSTTSTSPRATATQRTG
jgi:hypothetical protein